MPAPQTIFDQIKQQGIDFFTGVPDSLLKDFCAWASDHSTEEEHVIAANEGNATALAIGHYLGTGKPALVYMQNSGLGNAVNPLLSLADSEVYSIPMLLMIGWRGEPGVKDEPQHLKQGRVTTDLLDSMEIPWFELSEATADTGTIVGEACAVMYQRNAPVAIVVRKGAFDGYQLRQGSETHYPMNREDAVKCIVDHLGHDHVLVATTGRTSRELYEYRAARGDAPGGDFLTVGGMGHTASIAMGLARARVDRSIICLDGDGSVLMHMGALAIVGQSSLSNLIHVVMNNGAHDSVGGQPTVGLAIDLLGIAQSCGYAHALSVCDEGGLKAALNQLSEQGGRAGPVLLEVRVNKGARKNLGRPSTTPAENRAAFMAYLSQDQAAGPWQ